MRITRKVVKESNLMMIRNMKNWFMLVVLVFVMVAAGTVTPAHTATPAKRITLRMMVPSEPAGGRAMGMFVGTINTGQPVVYNVMEPLVDLNKEGKPVPKLATKWEHSADLTRWRFFLRKGVKFHNGADFTARDVVEFAKWNIELGKESPYEKYVPLKEAVAIDNYTVDLIFRTSQPLFLINAPRFLIPPLAVSRDDRDVAKTQVIGTGPYRWVEWKRGMYITLTKFEGYWGPKPQIDDVQIIFRAEEAVRLAALMAREVDWVSNISSEQASRAPKATHMPSSATVWIRFDEYIQKELGRESIFADKRLRLAVEYAIDRQALVALYGGFATPSLGQFASPGDFGYNPNLKSRPYDLEKARALVREAGAVGKTVTFVASTDRFASCKEVAEAVAYMIEKTGLKVKLMLMPNAEAVKYWRVQGEYRAYMSDLQINYSEAPLETEARYSDLALPTGGDCAINDPEPNRLYKEVLAETDYAKRGEKLGKTWAYLYEQAHYAPIFKLEWIWGLAKNLEWEVDIAGRPFFADMRFTD